MQLSKFLKIKLTKKDLQEYETILNDVYRKKIAISNRLFVAKNELLRDQITKEEYKELKNQEKVISQEYKKVLKNKAFKINLNNATSALKATRAENLDYFDAQEEFQKAKELYLAFKNVVTNRGKTAKVAKLNDWSVEVEDLSFRYNANNP